MLKVITWGQYILFVGSLVIGWYAYVFLATVIRRPKGRAAVYSSGERPEVFRNEAPEKNSGVGPDAEPRSEAAEDEPEPDWNLILQSILQELKIIIDRASDQSVTQESLVAELQVALVNYHDIKDTAYGGLISEFILKEASARGYDFARNSVEEFWD
jgi:hypothetical protein